MTDRVRCYDEDTVPLLRAFHMTDDFETFRPLLFSIAYRMLGSAMEAEDIVQEAYLRFQAAERETIQSLKSYLCAIVNHLCLDHLKSARVQRETYVGPWLPEPVLTGEGASLLSPMKQIGDSESISMAFLVLLESLSPLERAVFLLREVFEYEYDEIAPIVEREEAACRQLFSRAKKHISEHRPRFKATPEAHADLLGKFVAACQAGELDALTRLLAEDVTSWSDGGGKTHAAIRPVRGRDHVARFFLGLTSQLPDDASLEVAEVNGKLSLVFWRGDTPFSVISLDTDGGQIHAFHLIVNPDKLAYLKAT